MSKVDGRILLSCLENSFLWRFDRRAFEDARARFSVSCAKVLPSLRPFAPVLLWTELLARLEGRSSIVSVKMDR